MMPSDLTPPTVRIWMRLLDDVAARMAERGAHPARTVVLLPYAQLMPLAARLWRQARPDGFAPHFETTLNWSRRLRVFSPGPDDLTLDAARDILTAQTLLERAGLERHRDLLAPAVLEAAGQLLAQACALAPAQRQAWGLEAITGASLGLDPRVMALESAVAQLALAWVSTSSYATDILFEPWVQSTLDCVVLLDGFLAEPLTGVLQTLWGERALTVSLAQAAAADGAVRGTVALHAARDAEDEAQRAAACVLRHIEAGRTPVALAAIDRALTRRIRAMLDARQIVIRDENGWKLSTTRAAAQVMGVLRACAWNAPADAVLDWLKNSPAHAPAQVLALEKRLRRAGVRDWPAASAFNTSADEDFIAWRQVVEAQRSSLSRAPKRPLGQWLAALRELLAACGLWASLAADAAGAELLAVLRLDESAQAEVAAFNGQTRPLGLAEFTAWVNTVLESASYVPAYPDGERVVILPLSQLLARPFAALVAPGCDEVRLQASPDPSGPWTATQREALGLPSREQLASAVQAAWRHALQIPQCDLLWREGDDGGETLLPSPLVQLLQLQLQREAAAGPALTTASSTPAWRAGDPRLQRAVQPTPVQRPHPVGAALPVDTLSASAYDDLRHCPYRFFALRQLGLQEVDELDAEVDKRDFGQWLHALLKTFHEGLLAWPEADVERRRTRLDEAAVHTTRAMRLDDGEFLPFAAAWPRVRDGYLDWLGTCDAAGTRFERAEVACDMPLGNFTLVGRIDRIDQCSDGTALVIDYKTENPQKTKSRIQIPTEDTQLAFYAALLPHDTLRAAYVNVSEKEGTCDVELLDVVAVRDVLIEGLQHDMARIAEGMPLPALGEATVCDYCAARGLCRKDSWT
jgi:ATP-dependent helicase/nuclease subunit B